MAAREDPESLHKFVDALGVEQLQNCLENLDHGALEDDSTLEERLRIRSLFQRKLESFRRGRHGMVAVKLPVASDPP